jgi:hypothetical protein
MQDPSSLTKLEILPANPFLLRMAGFQAPMTGWFSAPTDTDARLLYATTSGKVHHLTRSNALQDYAVVVKRLMEAVPWLRRP